MLMEIQLIEILMAGTTQNAPGKWISLMDYAMKKGVSLSTLRRHIKANKLTFKVDDGRYLLWDEEAPPLSDGSQLLKLTQDLQRAQEEIAELKTLIALYEENVPEQHTNS